MYNLSVDEISMVDGGGDGQLGGILRYLSGDNALYGAIAGQRYAEYNSARQARNSYPNGSTTDMNSPGDQSMNDNAGGGR